MKTRFAEKTVTRGRSVQPSLRSGEGIKTEKSMTINRSPGEIYSFWHKLENLPRFMRRVQTVTPRDDTTISHWVVKTSHGRTLEWDARIIEDKPGQMISWQSLEGADMDNAGSVWFTPAAGGSGTVVKVSMKYSPPGGKLGAVIAKLLGDDPEKEMEEDLTRLKDLLERGEISGAA
jgi:uncharacterized membrane protein